MVSPTLLFLFLFPISTHLLSLATAQPPFLYQFCQPTYGNFTPNGTFHKNLNKALSAITVRSISSGGYFAHSVGAANSSGRVAVVGLCRGDVTGGDCFSCLRDSRRQLADQCPTSKEAVGWYPGCMLRYSNRSISAALDTDPSVVFYNLKNTTSDADRFDYVVVSLLKFLAGRAAGGGSGLKFATGNVSDAEARKVYGLAQCLPGLSAKTCNSCLTAAIEAFPKFFVGKIGGRILAPSCNYRYEVNMFYNLTAADVELTLPAEEPSYAPGPSENFPSPPLSAPARPGADAPSTNVTNTQVGNACGSVGVSSAYVAVVMLLSIGLFL